MRVWECQECGRTVESRAEPEQCPCGSTDIEGRPKRSLLGRLLSGLSS